MALQTPCPLTILPVGRTNGSPTQAYTAGMSNVIHCMASYTLYVDTGGETMTNVVTTRFPQDTIDALDAVAHERRRTRAEIVREAVDVYLARWADYGIALDRLADPSDEVVDADAFWREVEAEGE